MPIQYIAGNVRVVVAGCGVQNYANLIHREKYVGLISEAPSGKKQKGAEWLPSVLHYAVNLIHCSISMLLRTTHCGDAVGQAKYRAMSKSAPRGIFLFKP